jgi:hypothetical protein
LYGVGSRQGTPHRHELIQRRIQLDDRDHLSIIGGVAAHTGRHRVVPLETFGRPCLLEIVVGHSWLQGANKHGAQHHLDASGAKEPGTRPTYRLRDVDAAPAIHVITEADVAEVVKAARNLRSTGGGYVEDDFVTNLLVTVIDFQTHTTAVNRAMTYYQAHRFDQLRTMADLQALLAQFPDDQTGNTALAEDLWGYKMHTRAGLLRTLVDFFGGQGIDDQRRLRNWAMTAEFKRDFEGRVKGLGSAVFHGLMLRLGVDTVKPDVHVHRLVERAVGRRLSDADVVDVVVRAARRLGMKAHELDWAIWENARGGPA